MNKLWGDGVGGRGVEKNEKLISISPFIRYLIVSLKQSTLETMKNAFSSALK